MSWERSDGARIKITFDSPLTVIPEGISSTFTITTQEYDMVPGGTLLTKTKAVAKVYGLSEDASSLVLEVDPFQRFHSAVGEIVISYDGSGGIEGEGGLVDPFTESFIPMGLVPKPHQNNAEHLGIDAVAVAGSIIEVKYVGASTTEHIDISGVFVNGAITHINDI